MASIKDLKRMCKSYDDCVDCPMSDERNDCKMRVPCDIPDNADEIVDKWVAEHPAKTYAQDFFEKFPNARKVDNGRPCSCRKNIYGDEQDCGQVGCYDCWNEVMPDA